MAAGDIVSCTINADGISAVIRVSTITSGGTYLYDAANSSLVATASAKIVFTVVSKGFDATGAATTISRTVYGTKTRRVPGVATLSETAAGADLDIEISLSDPIYAKDNVGGGNSGTAPTVTMLASWYTKTGVPSAATTALACTNNSTLAYYVPMFSWYNLPSTRVTGNFRMAGSARHREGIAAVIFTCVGATSAVAANSTVTSEVSVLRPVSGLYASEYAATITLAPFTQNEQLNLRARCYPLVGDVASDTDSGTGYLVEGNTPITHWCDKSNALAVYGVVVVGAPGGTASATYAVAAADPFPTIKAALDANATVVYLKGVAHDFADRAVRKTGNYWTIVMPDPSELGTVVITIQGVFPTYDVQWLQFRSVTIKLSSNNSVLYGVLAGNYLSFVNCLHDRNTFTVAEANGVDSDGLWYRDCTWDSGDEWNLLRTGADTFRFNYDGCLIPNAGRMETFWRIVACNVDLSQLRSLVGVGTALRNVFIEFNRFTSIADTDELYLTATNVGYSIVGNLFEGVGVTPAQLLSVTEGVAFDVDHVIIAHNTFVGERENLAYNDSGVTAYYRRGWLIRGNIFKDYNTKHDLFAPPSAARVGGWWVNYGVGLRDNIVITTSSFHGDYSGLNFMDSTNPLFVNDQSGAGTGNGDYHLSAGSPGLNALRAGSRVTAFDQEGRAIDDDGTGAIGSHQDLPPVVVAGGLLVNRRRRAMMDDD